jgi:hypothetical protein
MAKIRGPTTFVENQRGMYNVLGLYSVRATGFIKS